MGGGGEYTSWMSCFFSHFYGNVSSLSHKIKQQPGGFF